MSSNWLHFSICSHCALLFTNYFTFLLSQKVCLKLTQHPYRYIWAIVWRIFGYSNIFCHEYSFVSYSYPFFDTNIFGHSFVLFFFNTNIFGYSFVSKFHIRHTMRETRVLQIQTKEYKYKHKRDKSTTNTNSRMQIQRQEYKYKYKRDKSTTNTNTRVQQRQTQGYNKYKHKCKTWIQYKLRALVTFLYNWQNNLCNCYFGGRPHTDLVGRVIKATVLANVLMKCFFCCLKH